MAAVEALLPRLKFTKSTLQYHKARVAPGGIFYTPQFQLTKEQFDKTLGQEWFHRNDPLMPVYPYGRDNRFPEANMGLYGGQTIQTGSKISKGRNKGKTNRTWFPNVKLETLRSQALGRTVTLPVTARVKRTIEKCGGLDQYILGNKPARIKELGLCGWKLRWLVMNTETMRKKFAESQSQLQRYPLDETFVEAWEDATKRQKFIAQQMQNWANLSRKEAKFREHFNLRLEKDQARKTMKSIPTLDMRSPETILRNTEVKDIWPAGPSTWQLVQAMTTGKKPVEKRPKFNEPATIDSIA